ncbi:MAG: lytic transglycosylase domain-containing protein [Desulfovibrio sp.]|jgi:soluble lytic murein transglycosylase-like protein|nr:lytic transglycosylase domain-containing protein [Desulfovibrio sp.]
MPVVPNKQAPLVSIPEGNTLLGQRPRQGLALNAPAGPGASSVDAFRGGSDWGVVAKGFEQATKAASLIAMDVLKERAETEANNAFAALNTDLDNFLHNPESGVLLRQGTKAQGSVEETAEFIGKRREQLAAGMSRAARQMFDSRAEQLHLSAQRSVSSHAGREGRQALFDSRKNAMAADALLIRNNPYDAQAAEEARARIAGTAQALGQMEGWDAGQIALYARQAVSETLRDQAEVFLDMGDYRSARPLLTDERMNLSDRARAAFKAKGLAEKDFMDKALDFIRNGDPFQAEKMLLADYPDLPAGVADMVTARAAEQGVPPALALAVLMSESGGKAGAVSKAGARGYMQVMPGTAKELKIDPDDPAQNIAGGVAYLRQMLDRYGGNEVLALQAYNWGPGNLDSWLQTGKGTRGQDMPKETRDYPFAVLGRYGDAVSLRTLDNSRRKTLEGELEKKKVDFLCARIRQDTSAPGLTFEERKERGLEAVAAIPDQNLKRQVKTIFLADMDLEKMRRDASDMRISREYREYSRKQGLSYSQAIAGVDGVEDLTEEGRERLIRSLYRGGQKETPENRAAMDEARRLIDTQEISDSWQLDSFAYGKGLTDTQWKAAAVYMERGGIEGQVKQTRIDRLWKELTRDSNGKSKPTPLGLRDQVVDLLEPGKFATDADLKKVISALSVERGLTDINWWPDPAETLSEAMRQGREDDWYPLMDEEDKKEAREVLAKEGFPPKEITEDAIKIKHRELFWKANFGKGK